MKAGLNIWFLLLFAIPGNTYAQITSAELQAWVDAGIDPYFKESRDTVSKQGPDCIVRDVLQDRKGHYWLATWQGIIQYDGKVFTNHTLKDGLIRFHVAACYEDKKGNLWFGTARGGVYRYDGRRFTLFTTKDGLADNNVSCFAEDRAGNIWLGTENGASRYDGKTFTNFTTKSGLRSNNVSAILQDKTGKLWFGCRSSTYMADDGGLSCYDGTSFRDLTQGDSLLRKGICSLLEDRNGHIWIGTFGGLTRYNGKVFKQIRELPPYLVYYIVEDPKGAIWLTSGQSNPRYDIAMQRLCRYDGRRFTKVMEKGEPGDNQIFGKIADKAGHIWFGTLKGVCRYDGKTFTYFRE